MAEKARYKLVNGVRIGLTPEESREIESMWAEWKGKMSIKLAKRQKKLDSVKMLKDRLNISDEEWMLLGKKI